MLYKKSVLRNFTKFTGKHLCQSFFFNKVAGLRPATLLKKRLWHRCFPVNFVKFLRTPFLQNTSGRLLLNSDKFGYSFIKNEITFMYILCIYKKNILILFKIDTLNFTMYILMLLTCPLKKYVIGLHNLISMNIFSQ